MQLSEEIKTEMIIDQLNWDNSVNASNVQVKVENSTAFLWGAVETFTAKMAAERDAYQVRGVTEVKNHLEIKFPPGRTLPEDKEIEQHIEKVLEWSNEIDASRIQVESNNHEVTLSGNAESFWEKHLSLNIANTTRGVLEVVDKLSVDPPRKISNSIVAGEIKKTLKRTNLIDEDKITVEVKNGSAILTGKVPNFYIKNQVYNIAAFTTGVQDVVDEIIIE